MRVLLVGKGAPERGGIAALLSSLSTSLEQRGHQVDLLNLTRTASYRTGRLNASNIVRTVTDAYAVWRQGRSYDVVHIHSAYVPAVTMVRAWLLCLAARSRGVPAVLHVHGGQLHDWLEPGPKTWLVRLTLRGIATVLTASRGLADHLAPFHPRVEFVANGVDAVRFHPIERHNAVPIVLYVGGLSPRKGVIDLMTASGDLLEQGVEHRLVLVGGRPDEGDHVEAEVRRAAAPHAELMGSVVYDDVPMHMASADIFCLPSWYEAMPLSLLEAMASGLPVVATTVGQIPEVVDSEVGALVPPKSPDQLAAALEALLTSPDLRAAAGAAARARVVTQYSLDAAIDRVEAAYHMVAGT